MRWMLWMRNYKALLSRVSDLNQIKEPAAGEFRIMNYEFRIKANNSVF